MSVKIRTSVTIPLAFPVLWTSHVEGYKVVVVVSGVEWCSCRKAQLSRFCGA